MEKPQTQSITVKVRELLRHEVRLYSQIYEADWLLSGHGICPDGFLEGHLCAIAGIIDCFAGELKADCNLSLHDAYQGCDAPAALSHSGRGACYGILLARHSQLIRIIEAFLKEAFYSITLTAMAQDALETHTALCAALRLQGTGKGLAGSGSTTFPQERESLPGLLQEH